MFYVKAFLLSITLLLTGCNEKDVKKIDDPEIVATVFFEALYNDRDVNKAASICSPKLARILLHYKSPEAIARHLFNMSFDSVTVTPDTSGVKVREQFKDKAKVTLFFDGKYNDNKLKDVKQVLLIQTKTGWVLDKILKDPF